MIKKKFFRLPDVAHIMKINIKKHIASIFLIAFCSLAYSQKGDAVLILKDSTRINGIGEISGISSIVSVKFKNDTLRYKTYRSKDIIGIDILENNYYRQFRYKYVDGAKFPEIMEIISIDSLSLYVRIFEGSVLSNSFISESIPILTIGKSDGKNIGPNRNVYMEKNFPKFSYYVGYGESDHVQQLYTKGLPFSRGFKESMKRYFKDCPALIDKVENDAFSNKELLRVIDFYNQNCLRTASE